MQVDSGHDVKLLNNLIEMVKLVKSLRVSGENTILSISQQADHAMVSFANGR